ncbi:acyl-CoA thioesterase [Coemansia sp. RSA 1813]|nr:acyl-CoA thioesterase [Coemansia sp. RSA 1646]KAJ1768698.1 acyl-CoA thioesterase [Coemansia sp. RSA 1843]KAJ2093619.1 acyl-CoA thioesterase [Coemansia sp. RSA 986]KAJ2214996.1 acyl-CoA thioesterase [Coemansia sp. RSA 487]KAJ2565745.1 acyl-CoA thioesterase [Coemansia sp. RSA 1813]
MSDNTTPFNERTLELEEVGPDTFLSIDLWQPKGNRGVFGGQVIGQAMSAAGKTVDSPYQCNSLHCYFLASGRTDEMIAYEVRRIRQGRSFCSRLVIAKQSGRVIFMAMVSFQRPEPSVLRHQYTMPQVPPPDDLLTREEHERRRREHAGKRADLGKMAEFNTLPVEMRHIPMPKDQQGLPINAIWMRAKGDMSGLGPLHHQSMLAYASDFAFIGTSLRPFQMNQPDSKYKLSMSVSLDHTIWFHEPFRADEWMLYTMESPRTASGRGLVLGRIYSQDGVLVASTAQEGVIRGTNLGGDDKILEFTNNIIRTPGNISKL